MLRPERGPSQTVLQTPPREPAHLGWNLASRQHKTHIRSRHCGQQCLPKDLVLGPATPCEENQGSLALPTGQCAATHLGLYEGMADGTPQYPITNRVARQFARRQSYRKFVGPHPARCRQPPKATTQPHSARSSSGSGLASPEILPTVHGRPAGWMGQACAGAVRQWWRIARLLRCDFRQKQLLCLRCKKRMNTLPTRTSLLETVASFVWPVCKNCFFLDHFL